MKKHNLLFLLSVCIVLSCAKEEDSLGETLDNQILSPPLVEDITRFIPCENGFAGGYPCSGFDLYAHMDLETFQSSGGNDNWGWTDIQTGKEYVLVGLKEGTAFVDISDPEEPLYLGKLPTATEPSIWRDIKVYQNHAYIVSEAANHGLQVFDLTRLRGLTETGQTFNADHRDTSFGNAHNIAINEDSGFAYVVGSQQNQGGPIFFDLSNPTQPLEMGGYALDGYAHDAQIVTYQGTDSEFMDREIYMGSHSDGESYFKLIILDVTDKANPVRLSEISYENYGYTHQNWISEDHRFIFLGDEVDELQYGGPTRTLVFDAEDLDNPRIHYEYEGVTNAIDHNGYVNGDYYYMANYTAGLRVIDVANIEENQMEEVGFFDTYPSNNAAQFNGVWNVYPFFESGIIAINDSNNGLFLVKKTESDQ